MARGNNYKSLQSYNGISATAGLPEKAKCLRCDKVKNTFHCFAKNRHEDLVRKIRNDKNFNPTQIGHIVCMGCSGQQVTELLCGGCDRWQGLNYFSKNQRKNPDNARCWKCLQDRLNMEPGAESSDEESNSGGDDSSDDSGEEYYTAPGGGSTVTGTMSALSIANGDSSTGGVALGSSAYSASISQSKGSSFNGSAAPSTSAGYASSVASTTTHGTRYNSTANGLSAGFDSKAYGKPPHLRARAPASDAGTVSTSGGGKFAKVKAGPSRWDMDAVRRQEEKDRAEQDDLGVEPSDSGSE